MSNLDDLIDNLVDCAWNDGAERLKRQSERTVQAITALRTHLAAPEPEPEHPGYILGSHWLETAYSRICAGEAEAEVLRDCGWQRVADIDALLRDVEALWRDAERYRWMKQKVKRIPPSWDLIGWDAAIDAAMEDKT